MVAALALASAAGCGGPPTPSPDSASMEFPLAVEGVTYSEYSGSRLSHRARARQLLVAPASFGPFQVALIDELILAGVQFDLFVDDACAGGTECLSALLDDPALGVLRISGVKGGLPVAGARLLDVTWVLWRGATPLARFSARQGSVRQRGGSLELRDVRLEHVPTGRVVEARRAVWDSRTRSFAIHGGYAVQAGNGRTVADRARMDFALP